MTLKEFVDFTQLDYGDYIVVYDYFKCDKWDIPIEYGVIDLIHGIPQSLNDHMNKRVHFQCLENKGRNIWVFID